MSEHGILLSNTDFTQHWIELVIEICNIKNTKTREVGLDSYFYNGYNGHVKVVTVTGHLIYSTHI